MVHGRAEALPGTARVAGGGMPAREEEAVLRGVAAEHASAAALAPLLRLPVVAAIVRHGVVRRAQARGVVLFVRQQWHSPVRAAVASGAAGAEQQVQYLVQKQQHKNQDGCKRQMRRTVLFALLVIRRPCEHFTFYRSFFELVPDPTTYTVHRGSYDSLTWCVSEFSL